MIPRAPFVSLHLLLASVASAMTAPADPAPATTGPSPLPEVMRNVLLWRNEPPHMVDLDRAKSLSASVVNVYPAPEIEGSWTGSLKPLPVMVKGMEKGWRADVEELHRAGIAVWTSFTTISFEPEIFKAHGLDPGRFYARDAAGNPQLHLGGYYGKQVYSSCYNNPDWMALERDTALLFLENGFGGIFYDVGGYADTAVLYCQCEHCKAKWTQHVSAAGLDPATPLPTPESGGDMTQAVNRDHLRWRYACWEEAWKPVRDAVKRANPRFVLGQNMSARVDDNRADGMIFNATTDLYDYVHFEEWGHGAAPYSILPSYLMALAAGGGKPAVIVWNMGPFHSPAQQRIAFAEAYAAGGVCQNSRDPDIKREYHDFQAQHEELYRDTTSLANVGVVISLWSRAFHEVPKGEHAAWWFGQMLLDMHVPFDYLIAERDLTPETLRRYRTLILPNAARLANEHVAALDTFLRDGGGIYATAETGVYDQEMNRRNPSVLDLWTGEAVSGAGRKAVGDGRLAYDPGLPEKAYWDASPRDPDKDEPLALPAPPPSSVAEALAWVFGDSLSLQVEAKPSTVIVPKRQGNRLLLHLVNYNTYPDGKELTPDRNVALRITLPQERDVDSVTLLSPDDPGETALEGWSVQDGNLTLTVEEVKHYSVIVVGLKPEGRG